MPETERSEIALQPAIDRAIEIYIATRKEKVPAFVHTHFSIAGAFKLNRKALGTDLIKTPINMLWSVPYTGLTLSAALLKRGGYGKMAEFVGRLPVGFDTRVQKEIKWLIYADLLEIPFEQEGRQSTRDALLAEIINQREISDLFSNELSKIYTRSKNPRFRPALENNLLQYARTRTAAAELAGNLLSLSAGAAMFGKVTPGAMTVGSSLAGAIAQQLAISNSILGTTLGSLYYSIFPASASLGLLVATTGSIVAALAILASFAGIISDPLQAKLGLHQKRLLKLIDCLDKELKGLSDSRFKIREHYISRVFDLLDMLRTAARTVVM
jgi:hypothetical protein